MIKLKNKGEFYDCGLFSVASGEIVEVSEEKAEQLLSDFPQNWEAVEPGKKEEAKIEAPAMEKAEGNSVSKDNKKGTLKNKK